MERPLLSKLKKLLEIDRSISFDSQNPDLYRKHGLALQEVVILLRYKIIKYVHF